MYSTLIKETQYQKGALIGNNTVKLWEDAVAASSLC
jgi:hypothetical protein